MWIECENGLLVNMDQVETVKLQSDPGDDKSSWFVMAYLKSGQTVPISERTTQENAEAVRIAVGTSVGASDLKKRKFRAG